MTNLPAGKELDAAVLAAMGLSIRKGLGNMPSLYWVPKGSQQRGWIDIDGSLSTSDPEALRLCGPWLDERCRWWAVTTGEMHIFGMGATKHGDSVGTKTGNAATRAEAICRLVLAVAEREGK